MVSKIVSIITTIKYNGKKMKDDLKWRNWRLKREKCYQGGIKRGGIFPGNGENQKGRSVTRDRGENQGGELQGMSGWGRNIKRREVLQGIRGENQKGSYQG